MKRRLVPILNVLCLLLILAIAGLWVRSYFVTDLLYSERWWLEGTQSTSSAYWFDSSHGAIRVGHRSQHATQRPDSVANIQRLVDQSPKFNWTKQKPRAPTSYPNASFRFLGVEIISIPTPAAFVADGVTARWTDVRFPHGLLCLLLALPSIWLLIKTYRARRHRPGHCRTCGYDLRASPTRCPECGTPAELEPASPSS